MNEDEAAALARRTAGASTSEYDLRKLDRLEAAVPTMRVRVRDRGAELPWGSGLTNPVVRTVTIRARCPVCGGPRGEPRNLNQCDDGAWYSSDVWDNPCGHVDSYAAVIREAGAP